jgi:hypothetical protein
MLVDHKEGAVVKSNGSECAVYDGARGERRPDARQEGVVGWGAFVPGFPAIDATTPDKDTMHCDITPSQVPSTDALVALRL